MAIEHCNLENCDYITFKYGGIIVQTNPSNFTWDAEKWSIFSALNRCKHHSLQSHCCVFAKPLESSESTETKKHPTAMFSVWTTKKSRHFQATFPTKKNVLVKSFTNGWWWSKINPESSWFYFSFTLDGYSEHIFCMGFHMFYSDPSL